MHKLSPSSLRFLQQLKRNPSTSKNEESYGQAYTQLFCELYDIMRDVKESLEKNDIGTWTLTYQGSELDRSLSFSFNFNRIIGSRSIDLNLTINPLSTSSISITSDIPSHIHSSDALAEFRTSPAYRRYFAPHTSSLDHLRTEISQRQINSRHFGDYLIHIGEMAMPYIKSLQEGVYSRQLAVA